MRKRVFWIVLIICALFGAFFPKINYAVDNTYKHLKILMDMMEIIDKNYVDNVESKKLIYGAARGMVDQLDDFSQFMEEDLYNRVKDDTEGEFGGIGIKLEVKDGWPTVITPMLDTPAYKAGMYPGDKIIKISSESTKNMLSDEVVKRLRGKPKTKVNLTIAREPEKKDDDWITKDLELTREVIKPEAVKYKMLESDIAYLRVTDFSGHLIEDFEKNLKKAVSQKAVALIVDLRYNPGGLLMGSVDLARFFLGQEKMIVFTRGKNNSNYQEFRAQSSAPYENIPMVVLINKYSASASEIFAGAMQDNKRAVIVGETSFGKASVQQLMPLSDGSALRLTIAHYYTPNGKMIHRDPKTQEGGIKPDMEIKITREDELKIFESMEEIYYPQNKLKSEKEKVKDEYLNRAIEIIKARESFLSLKK